MNFLKGCGIISLLTTIAAIAGIIVWYYSRYHNYAPAIEDAIQKCDFKTAHEKLSKQYTTLQRRNGNMVIVKTFENEYVPIAQHLFDAELNFLTKNKNDINESKVLSLMEIVPIYGTPMLGAVDSKNVIKDNDYYITSISRYNYALDKILSKAIALKNKSLAEKVLPLYKANLRKTMVKSHVFGSDEFSYEYTNEAQENAEQKYRNEFFPSRKGTKKQLSEEIEIEDNTRKQLASDVDTNIPKAATSNPNTFVVIYANEDYKRVGKVPFAKQDGKIFAEYCRKTLGVPDKNIHLVENATLNDMRSEIYWLSQICDAFNGEAKVIVYYSGHGIPDESEKTSYILPVDGDGNHVNSGYKLNDFYEDLGKMPAKMICVFMDACFSGMRKDGEALVPARGVALKAKSGMPKGNMVVFSAAQGDETAYPYADKRHGMLTYYLLRKLQESAGDVTLQELGTYLTKNVRKKSLVENNKQQTPTVTPSSSVADTWQTWKLK